MFATFCVGLMEVEKQAVAELDCESCGQSAGEKCLREVKDSTPYASKPSRTVPGSMR
jgi:hypothetical protein